ncbi:MAG TPA: 4-(cytidine 5'-diphospho)-2-C-methyl-D-erythritol kinase [Candidatus Dormibacteraeota bacterium]|nr:4-(cytidine 5'-diphospho)-2-C-methyl-D-erythritol kinase [Candidatus Dormibacteraeota bacterium]
MALILPAYAKLNLTLDVIGRRPNGYHDIDSVMQTISLHDLLSVERTDCRVFEVIGPAIEGENLVLKAARELEGHLGRALPFTIRLFKRIPMGAGLGGGSADAAAFLKAANQLYDLRLKPEEMIEVATAIGQDVPFFIRGGTAHATGLGSTVSLLPPAPAEWRFLVICPAIQVSTKAVYDAVDGTEPSGRRTPELIELLQTSLQRRGDLDEIFGNDLEPVTRRLFPDLERIIENLREPIPTISMTGTGSALFAVFDNRREARTAFAAISKVHDAWLCRPVPAG